MRIDEDDLIRNQFVRISIFGLGILTIIIGSKHIAYHGMNWSGGIVGIFGIILLFLLHSAYENLLKEKQ